MPKHVYGLVNVELGTIETDGGMSLATEIVGETVSGTAILTTEDPTTTDFNVEESDLPVESISQQGKVTLAWSTYNVSAYNLYKFFGGTYTPYKAIATFGAITGGTGYTNGTYKNVALTGGTGQEARADITVAGGIVTAVTLTQGGYGYTVADSMSASTATLGAGTGFAVPVATLTNGSGTFNQWDAPDSFADVEKSIKLTDKKGNVTKIPRAKIAPKMQLSYAKDKLGQVDIVATLLQPTKAGEKRLTIVYA